MVYKKPPKKSCKGVEGGGVGGLRATEEEAGKRGMLILLLPLVIGLSVSVSRLLSCRHLFSMMLPLLPEKKWLQAHRMKKIKKKERRGVWFNKGIPVKGGCVCQKVRLSGAQMLMHATSAHSLRVSSSEDGFLPS